MKRSVFEEGASGGEGREGWPNIWKPGARFGFKSKLILRASGEEKLIVLDWPGEDPDSGLGCFESDGAGAFRSGRRVPCWRCRFHVALMIFFCSSTSLLLWLCAPDWPACPPAGCWPSRKI